jgi:hypothetical protein
LLKQVDKAMLLCYTAATFIIKIFKGFYYGTSKHK